MICQNLRKVSLCNLIYCVKVKSAVPIPCEFIIFLTIHHVMVENFEGHNSDEILDLIASGMSIIFHHYSFQVVEKNKCLILKERI